MDMKYLFIILFYYVGVGMIFSTFPANIIDGTSQTGSYQDYNVSGYSEDEIGSGSVTDVLGTIGRFLAFATIGYGIPNSPAWLQLLVSGIAILMDSIVIFTIKNMIWTGGG